LGIYDRAVAKDRALDGATSVNDILLFVRLWATFVGIRSVFADEVRRAPRRPLPPL
jgi:hypothetical protein